MFTSACGKKNKITKIKQEMIRMIGITEKKLQIEA